MENKKKIGLALSGGGVKGAVHAGMIHFFDEIGFKPTIIASTSTGAIVGSLYASGLSGLEILNFFLTERPFSRSFWSGNGGLINTPAIGNTISKYIKNHQFEELHIPLITTATNMLTGKETHFSSGDLVSAVLASAAFPGVFTPMEMDGVLYSDGGLQNHFPADIIRSDVDFLIGMHLSPIKILTLNELTHTKDILARTFDIQGAGAEFSKLKLCEIGICPEELVDYGSFDFNKDHINEMFKIGYNEIKKHENQLMDLMATQNE